MSLYEVQKMDLIQSLFNYAWQAVVYAFIIWLIIYFLKSTSVKNKVLISAACGALLYLGVTSGFIEAQFDQIDSASEQHIKHIQAIQNTYES